MTDLFEMAVDLFRDALPDEARFVVVVQLPDEATYIESNVEPVDVPDLLGHMCEGIELDGATVMVN